MDATQLPIAASPLWSRALPPGPDARVKITAAYAKLVGRDAYFWAWPMVNLFNRRQLFASVKQQQYQGPLMQAPLNLLAMLMDYVSPEERAVACPNQDVVYGMGALALDISPVVVQVPDFGDRFWVYQIVDLRTEASRSSARCMAPRPASTCWRGPTGTRTCQRALRGCSAVRPTVGSSFRGYSRTTRRRTNKRSRRCCRALACIRWRNSTGA